MSHSSVDIIKNALKNNKLSHAYLFYGDNGVDVEKPILNSIQLILESRGKKLEFNDFEHLNYYDFKMIKPTIDNKIKKEMVDSTISLLFDTPLEPNGIKFLYIKDVDTGNKSSLNRLLKFVEEPVENLIIFMSTNYFDGVISTIRSRTQNIYVKRESIQEKINEFSKIIPKEKQQCLNLLANIYSNSNQIQQINLDSFLKTYLEILEILSQAIKYKYILKIKLDKLWTKHNSEYVLNILQFFYYQIMIEINQNYPLFPNEDKLIINYKTKNIDYFEIEKMVDEIKKNLKIYGNFELQKMKFLNELEKMY